MLPPNVLDDGVDPEQARQGVMCTASYPLTRAFDRIRVRCGGETIDHVVTEDEARSGGPVQVRIEEAVFKEVGDTAKCVLTYTVWDWIGNSVDLDALWSAALELFVSLNGIWLEPPLVSEDPEDVSDDPDSIDLGKLGGRPAIAQVHAQRSWQRNDVIELTCTSKTALGASEVLILEETVTSAPFIYKLSVPHAHFVAAVGGSATFKYKLLRAGKEVGRSFTTRVDVIGEALIELPLVTVVGVPGLVVDPLASLTGQIARVEFAQAQTGDLCQLFARPLTADGQPTFTAKAFNANNRVNNTLAIEDLVARHGTYIRLLWELTRNGIKTRSKPTLLTVQKIADGDSRLPTPKVPQAPDDKVLDLSKFEGDAEVKVLPWLGIRGGQRVWMRCIGTKPDETEHIIELLVAHSLIAEEVLKGLTIGISRAQLALLKSNSLLQVEVKVAFDAGSDDIDATHFQTLKLNIVNFTFGFENWEGRAIENLPFDTPIRFSSGLMITVVNAGGLQVPATIAPAGPGNPGVGTRTFTSGSAVKDKFQFGGLVESVSFTYAASHSANNKVLFFDGAGLEVGSWPLVIGNNLSQFRYSLDRGLSYFELHIYDNDGGITIDEITWS
ncbi:hypothetical protein [Pseudomonas sp. PMCC200344]|uniref:hypothetical protein n=1 Tax=Pseudomonas sp. PMCC200344 TaxID=3042028 RepID=UPI0024B36CE7|nr:hypothetical protein [Pseudomonas sp. PMCC200344]